MAVNNKKKNVDQAISHESAKKKIRFQWLTKLISKNSLKNHEVAAKQFFIHVKTISTTHRWKFTSVKAHTNAITVHPTKLQDINLNNEEKDKILFKDNLENGIGTVSSTRNDTYAGAKCISTCISAMNDKVRSDNPIEQAKNIQEFIKDNDPIIVRSNKTSFIEGALQEAMYSPLNVEHRSYHGKGKKGSDKQGYSKKAGKTNPTIKLLTQINNVKNQIYKQKLDAFINPSNEATQGLEISANAPQPKQEQKDLPKIEQVTQQAFSQLLKSAYDFGNRDGEYIDKNKKSKKIDGKANLAKLASFVKIAARDTHQADTLLETIIDQNIVNISASKLHEPSRKETQKVLSSYLFDKKGNIKGLVQLDVDRAQSQSESTAHQGAQDLNLDVFGNAENVKDYDKTAKIVQEAQESNNVASAVVASLTKDIEAVLTLKESKPTDPTQGLTPHSKMTPQTKQIYLSKISETLKESKPTDPTQGMSTKMQQFYITGILDRLLPDANFTQKANLLRFAASQNDNKSFQDLCEQSAKIIELEGKFIKKPNAKNYENLKIAGGGNVSQLIQNNSTPRQVGKLLRAIIAQGKPGSFQEAFDIAGNIKDKKLKSAAVKTIKGSIKSFKLSENVQNDMIFAAKVTKDYPKLSEKILEKVVAQWIKEPANKETVLKSGAKINNINSKVLGSVMSSEIMKAHGISEETHLNVFYYIKHKLDPICQKQSNVNKIKPEAKSKKGRLRFTRSHFEPKNYFQKHDQQMLKNKIQTLVEEERTNNLNKQPLTSKTIDRIMDKALGKNLVDITIDPKYDTVKIGETEIKKEDFKKSLDNIQDRFKEQVEQIKAALDSNIQVHNLQIPEAVINATGLITQETFFNPQEIAEYATNHKGELINENSGLTRPEIKQLKETEKQEKSKQNEAPKLQRSKKSRNLLALVEKNIANNQQPPKAVAADRSANVTISDTANLNQENQRPSLGAGA